MRVKVTRKKATKCIHKNDHCIISIYAQTVQDCKDLKCTRVKNCDNIRKFFFLKRPALIRECKRYVVKGGAL